VYRDQGILFKGGGFTKSVVPPPGPDSQEQMGKDLKAKGWDSDRAITELRKNTVEDKDGNKQVNLAGMTSLA
jgi:hypothetical protein